MSIEYPLNKNKTSLGTIADPTITIEILTKYGYRFFEFLLDTGADCTMLPKFMAEIIGLDLTTCQRTKSFGIEGKGVLVYIGKIDIKIGQHYLKVKCLFSEDDTTPFILGRLGLFSQFNILFDNRNKKIRLTKI